MLDFFSIILALISWGIVGFAMVKPTKKFKAPFTALNLFHQGYLYVVLSLGACAIAVQLQVFQIMSYLDQGLTELGDTIDQVILVCGLLIAVDFTLLGLSILLRTSHSVKERAEVYRGRKNERDEP